MVLPAWFFPPSSEKHPSLSVDLRRLDHFSRWEETHSYQRCASSVWFVRTRGTCRRGRMKRVIEASRNHALEEPARTSRRCCPHCTYTPAEGEYRILCSHPRHSPGRRRPIKRSTQNPANHPPCE